MCFSFLVCLQKADSIVDNPESSTLPEDTPLLGIKDLLRMAERIQNGAIRERAEFIRSLLGARTGLAEQETQRH
jgi:hypothetical protein